MKRSHSTSTGQRLLVCGALGVVCLTAADARAQVAGTAARPLPDVLLLVDTSGSMERMPNNTIPTCTPGTATDPNRWGMLLQALTGNIQPYFSCAAVKRGSSEPFATRYRIGTTKPYDVDYALDFHQPLADTCAIMPWKLPGASFPDGVGQGQLGAGGAASSFPDDALASVGFVASSTGYASYGPSCLFEQTNDGQLDVARDYARFALMTFDNDTHSGVGTTAQPFKGQWSYLRTDTSGANGGNEFFATPSNSGKPAGATFLVPADENPASARGRPGTSPVCTVMTLQEIGARNKNAPPWEGRLVPFAPANASIYQLARQNEQLQQVLLASRPYGATPIDGMMDDARDFLWNSPDGPNGTNVDAFKCRDRYAILLTDGAPNLDLRPSCAAAGGICPYPKTASQIAADMFAATGSKHVKTYVIGFSVNGDAAAPNNDGFPSSLTPAPNCRTWFDTSGGTAATMQTACNSQNPPPGSTARACCTLNDIALQGAGVGAFFAESQADIVLAFGRIMANIIRSASTKTTPVMATTSFEAVSTTSSATSGRGLFLSSFIPSSQRPWSGELDRQRFTCDGTTTPPKQKNVTQSVSQGDFMSDNLARQSVDKKRLFISVLADADATTSAIDSAASVRPFANPTPATSTGGVGGDGIIAPGSGAATYSGQEVNFKDLTAPQGAPAASWPLWAAALNINGTTCKRGRAVKTGVGSGRGTVNVPALTDPTECTRVIWGFTTATPTSLFLPATPPPAPATQYEFNTRCRSSLTAQGTCSITGSDCVPSASPTTCPAGEACIPRCAALGAIFHSTPAAVTAPESLLREEGFRSYQANRRTRRTVIYTATTDGILHAFKALDEGDVDAEHELWSFVPPAVLPRLSANYPGGNQILLDGAPVVRETLWDRKTSDETVATDWHTTLVAGLGTTGGYYALNVTDADCKASSGQCFSNYDAPTKNTKAHVATSGLFPDPGSKSGPHFLWQLTDVPEISALPSTTETGKRVRKSKMSGTPEMVALFGRNTSTPAIGTIAVRVSATENRLVGVAILPGGYDEPPIDGGYCARVTKTAAAGELTADRAPRTYVRKWEKDVGAINGCDRPVPGRGVTIVRLDNGEIIRHFGRTTDIPARILAKTIPTKFDSPMVGTPVVYPDKPGVPIQKIFIGDADGTVWRIDLANADPSQWRATLYSDLFAITPSPADPSAAFVSQPIQVPPVLSLDDGGNVILHVATGDQESIVYSSTDKNYVYAIRETRDFNDNFAIKGQTLWYRELTESERVTGPMTVFDRVLYFASYKPGAAAAAAAASCDNVGFARLWGLHATIPQGGVATGGRWEWCPTVDGTTGLCTVPKVDKEDQADPALIPGVTLTRSLTCVDAPAGFDAYGNGAYASVSQTSFNLSFGVGKTGGVSGAGAQTSRGSRQRPVPLLPSRIDSWSLVME